MKKFLVVCMVIVLACAFGCSSNITAPDEDASTTGPAFQKADADGVAGTQVKGDSDGLSGISGDADGISGNSTP